MAFWIILSHNSMVSGGHYLATLNLVKAKIEQ